MKLRQNFRLILSYLSCPSSRNILRCTIKYDITFLVNFCQNQLLQLNLSKQTLLQQDYFNCIHNWDSFTDIDYLEQLHDHPHLGRELSILFSNMRNLNKPRKFGLISTNHSLKPEISGLLERALKSQINLPFCIKSSPSYFSPIKKTLLASWFHIGWYLVLPLWF